MPSIETYHRQTGQLVRWHRERNRSIGEKFRLLDRYRHLTDIEGLEMPMPLTLAQEIVAAEAGFADWAALEASARDLPQSSGIAAGEPTMTGVVPILFVHDVAAAAFYAEKLPG